MPGLPEFKPKKIKFIQLSAYIKQFLAILSTYEKRCSC